MCASPARGGGSGGRADPPQPALRRGGADGAPRPGGGASAPLTGVISFSRGPLTEGELSRIRECPGARDCGCLFCDTSRNGTRRWCSREGCGSRGRCAGSRPDAGKRTWPGGSDRRALQLPYRDMRHTRGDVVRRTVEEYEQLDELIGRLRPEDWDHRVPRPEGRDPWTVKDALVHIVWWKEHTTRVIRRQRR